MQNTGSGMLYRGVRTPVSYCGLVLSWVHTNDIGSVYVLKSTYIALDPMSTTADWPPNI
jgi:hypothetical protein